MEATELDHLVHAFGYSRYAEEYRSHIVKENIASKEAKHMTLLDGLALLLVNKTDVAAVSLRRVKDEVQILYAMNRDAITKRAAVVNEVLEIANSIVQAESLDKLQRREQLMDVILNHCQQKLERRREKVVEAWVDLKKSEPFSIAVPSASAIADFASGSPSLAPRLSQSTWAAWLAEWFDNDVSRPFFATVGNTPPATTSGIRTILVNARLLGRKKELSVSTFPTAEANCLTRRLSKLGQFLEAILQITKSASQERARNKGSIVFRAIPVSFPLSSFVTTAVYLVRTGAK
jgi:hypothetical protein